jgi:exonuclease SbcC
LQERRRELGNTLAAVGGRAAEAARAVLTTAGAAESPPQCPESSEPAQRAASLRAFLTAIVEVGDETIESLGAATAVAMRSLESLAGLVGVEPEDSSVEIVEQLTSRVRELEAYAAELSRQVDDVALRIQKRAAIEATIASDSETRALYQRLGSELQADRFLDYVLGESMRTLAALATVELLKITGERYSIRARESAFDVIDHQNADERRSVSTLSGGETFLASLALALALSASIRDLAGNAAAARVESMFIDEGFGALDADSLETAVSALERLVEEHRMIGVISHVPALSERLPAGLDVRKVGVSSTITRR